MATPPAATSQPEIATQFSPTAAATILTGDSAQILRGIPDQSAQLIITSPPYNVGKAYEQSAALDEYLAQMAPILDQLVRILDERGSLCWQVGNYVDRGEIVPLDMVYYPLFKSRGLKLRNRIVWHFDHGLHSTKRFSGRYEVLLWFTHGDNYTFHLDPVRVPAKYPGKTNYKPGPNYGKPSGNPLGKNPSDFWTLLQYEWEQGLWCIPNVKANHPEKTLHPCQFPIELVERCVLALTNPGDLVVDPFSGVGTSLLAALKHSRRGLGCEQEAAYNDLARQRIADFYAGSLGYRPLGKPVHQPTGREKVARVPSEWQS